MNLTEKQKRFADKFIETGNATQSAIDAGYSKRTARSIGAENLTKPDIKKYIDDRLKLLDEQSIAKQKEILQILTRLVRREEPEIVTSLVRKPTKIKMTAKDGTTYDKFAYEDVIDSAEVKTKNSDVTKAAELLLRIFNAGNTSELTNQRIEQMKANTELTKARTGLIKGVKADTSLLDALVDALHGGDGSGKGGG
ncbi:terminase small subunit [Sporolactobacillus sp. CQH2019]|uniref:terminase small subunit n=1 Tax=Sporolactobacillus sp. CQH2019 TaxID=3023512 RepID=UPI0023689815|nr:terminase small subunit [Sporolactobacillus sp. CQH2019]MDD9147836.1 terminase small subunit [Sporolactobacillus sp. CQH2019]